MTTARPEVPMKHKLITLPDHAAFVWWPLFPKWVSPLRSPHGHSKPTQADFLAREPDRKVGILFGRN